MTTTFSQLVDEVVKETLRVEMLPQIANYANQTIREMQAHPQSGGYLLFPDSLCEDLITVDANDPFGWDIPNPDRFMAPAAARYDSVYDLGGSNEWAVFVRPGKIMDSRNHFAYRSGQKFFFKGAGGQGATISFSWYEYVRTHKYYRVDERPATYDVDSGWTYHAQHDADDDARAAAREMVANWILMRWPETVREGVRAKVYKRTGDESRARLAYSAYQSARLELVQIAGFDAHGVT